MSAQGNLRSHGRTALRAAVRDSVALLDMPGQLVSFEFRGRRCTVIADLCVESLTKRPAGYNTPVTDVVMLELITGSGQESSWPRPVTLNAMIESGHDAIATLRRASRWASYAARVAVVPENRVTNVVVLEATLRGIWVVAAGRGRVSLVVQGDERPVAGATRGLLHRLLDEVVAEALLAAGAPSMLPG